MESKLTLVVFDLTTLIFLNKVNQLLLLSTLGEQLGQIDLTLNNRDEIDTEKGKRILAANLLQKVTDTTWIVREGQMHRVGFYNPHSGELSWGEGKNSKTYINTAKGGFLRIAEEGSLAYADTEETLVLTNKLESIVMQQKLVDTRAILTAMMR
jgi:hypothetical protein